jgi:hypothetical protein
MVKPSYKADAKKNLSVIKMTINVFKRFLFRNVLNVTLHQKYAGLFWRKKETYTVTRNFLEKLCQIT